MLIVTADGIGSAGIVPGDSRSIIGNVTARLAQKTARHQVVPVHWPAAMVGIGGRTSWAVSAHIGVLDLDRIAAEHPGEDLVQLGYSGGCRVIHDWLATRPQEHHRVAAVGLMSDPYRPSTRWQDNWKGGLPYPGGSGVAGSRVGPIGDRTFWTSAPGDVISSCPSDSPLRTAADLSDQIPGALLVDLAGHLRQRDWQLATYMGLWRRDPLAYLRGLGPRLDRARLDIEGYLTGAHTLAYTRPHAGGLSLAHRLADTVAWKVSHR